MPISKLKCCNCKERFPREQMIKSLAGNLCGEKCLMDKVKGKKREKADKQHKLRKKVFYANDLKYQHKLTQLVFNKLRRLQELEWFHDRGLEPECISCGKTNMDWCCGHLKTVGSQGSLRYDEMNTKLQCNRYCNMGLSGNISGNKTTRGYLIGLLERFGKEESERIIEYCSRDRIKSWSGLELFEMRKELNKQIKSITSKEYAWVKL